MVDGIIVGTYLFGCAMVITVEYIVSFVTTDLEAIEPGLAAELPAYGTHLQGPWLFVSIALVAVVALALAYRRRFPLLGLIVVAASMCVEQGWLVAPGSVALVFLLYAVPVYRSVAAGWLGFAIAVSLNTLLTFMTNAAASGLIGPNVLLAEGPLDVREALALSIANALWLLVVLLFAINLGNRRRYVAALIDRAHQLAREREQRAQLAAAEERSRIAREMHDIVAHSLSVVVTLSEAASVAIDTKPDAAKNAMERAAETGRSALVEMRRLLGVLSDGQGSSPQNQATREPRIDAAPRSPQPDLSQLQELVAGFRQAGMQLSVSESGVPRGDASQQLAVYRIVQEGLTNALRYAGSGASVCLVLGHSDDATNIEIIDTGAAASPVLPEPGGTQHRPLAGTGRGLAGAEERARMFGGALSAGPSGGGWKLTATVPITHDEFEKQRSTND